MSSPVTDILQDFSSLGLADLNQRAALMQRSEKKYIVQEDMLLELLSSIKNEFQILEIEGKRSFSYDNIYMDTKEYLFYYQHEDKLKNRTKIRTRKYMDSDDLCFFEYKHKCYGITKKYRYQVPQKEHGHMTKGKKRFFSGIYDALHNSQAPEVSPSIKTSYKRITLIHKHSEERITIDFDICLENLRNNEGRNIQLEKLVIVEVKARDLHSESRRIMNSFSFTEADSCSKYALGVIYSGAAKDYKTFRSTMNRIQELRIRFTNKKRAKQIRPTLETPTETFIQKKERFVKRPLCSSKNQLFLKV